MGFHHWLGATNFIVFALFVAWLSTRPFWIAPLRRTLKVGANELLGPYLATLNVGTDGAEINAQPWYFSGNPPKIFRFYVDFDEPDKGAIMHAHPPHGLLPASHPYTPPVTP